MKADILNTITNKNDYLAVLDATTGIKTVFTQEEKETLQNIYMSCSESWCGSNSPELAKLLLALDTAPDKATPGGSPLADGLSEADLSALGALYGLCADWERKPEKAEPVKTAALSGSASSPLTLALARAALDAYAGQNDAAQYLEEITALADLLRQTDDAGFTNASAFLVRVRERCR